jgi:uncharacterized protein (TIRG00374 family)
MVSLGGEPYRILELKNYIGLQKATSSVILYSMTHFTSHFLLWLTTSIFVLFYYDLSLGFIIGLSIVILICAGLITLFFTGYRKGLLVKTFRILSKIPLIKGWAKRFSQTRKGNIAKIDSQIAELYTRKKDFYGSLLLEYSARIVGCLEVYFISLALSAGLNFLDSVVVIAATSLFSNILFFSPLQLGTREGGFLLVFEALKSSSAFGMAMSLITRIRETIWIIIGLILMNGKVKDTIKKTEEDPIL